MAASRSYLSPLGQPSNIENAPDMIESDMEDEVDQLDSDSDVEETENDTSSKKNGQAGVRIPGHSLLPALKLENIIQADGVTGNLALSKEGLFILSIATEEFIKRMAEAGQLKASSERRSAITYGDMAATTQQYQEFMFLGDTIPAPLSISEALLMREAKEKELFDDDPAMSASTSLRHSTSTTASASTHRPKVKTRNPNGNGHEKRNGSVPVTKREGRPESRHRSQELNPAASTDLEVDGESSVDDHGFSAGLDHPGPVNNGRASVPARPSPLANGHSSTASRSGTITPAQSRDDPSEHPSPRHLPPSRTLPLASQEDAWPGQYTGPASGFLQGPGGPFGRVAQNPGRTIYSQQHRAE